MSKMSRDKGKRGERLWRDVLRAYGFVAERAGYKQAAFGGGGADVEDNSGLWWEVKFVEKLNVRQAYEQAAVAAAFDQPPAVAHKTSSKPWLVTMAGEDFLLILQKLKAAEVPPADAQQQSAGCAGSLNN